jgi:hypothetical protein
MGRFEGLHVQPTGMLHMAKNGLPGFECSKRSQECVRVQTLKGI